MANDSGDADLVRFSHRYLDALLNVTIFESLIHGIYTTFVGLTLWMLLAKEARNGNTRIRAFSAVLVTTMYLLATAYLALRWNLVRQTFLIHGDSPSSAFAYAMPGPKMLYASSIVFGVNTTIADSILIWRCWVIWGNRWAVVILPSVCTLIGTIFAGLSTSHQFVAPPSGTAWSQAQIEWSLPYFSISLAVTLICTCMIVYRVLTVGRATTATSCFATLYRAVHYNAVVEILVESAALYSISLIVWLAFYVRGVPEATYPLVILNTATALAPTLIIYRVCAGQTRPAESWKEPPTSVLFFATASDLSRTVTIDELPGAQDSEQKREIGHIWTKDERVLPA